MYKIDINYEDSRDTKYIYVFRIHKFCKFPISTSATTCVAFEEFFVMNTNASPSQPLEPTVDPLLIVIRQLPPKILLVGDFKCQVALIQKKSSWTHFPVFLRISISSNSKIQQLQLGAGEETKGSTTISAARISMYLWCMSPPIENPLIIDT